MDTYMRYKNMEVNTLESIRNKINENYNIDLVEIEFKYRQLEEEIISEKKDSKIKVSIKGMHKVDFMNQINNSDNPEKDYKKYYKYFEIYEYYLFDNYKPTKLDDIKQYYLSTYGLDIVTDLDVDLQIFNDIECNKFFEYIFGIDEKNLFSDDTEEQRLSNLNLMTQYHYYDINKFREAFENMFHVNLDQKYKQYYCVYKNDTYNMNKLKKQQDIKQVNENGQMNAKETIDGKKYFNYFWNIIRINNISGIDQYNIFSGNYNKYKYFSGHRKDVWQDSQYTYEKTVAHDDYDIFLFTEKEEYQKELEKVGKVKYIEEQLESLLSYHSEFIKIAVLLDLFWNINLIYDQKIQVKLQKKEKSIDSEINENRKYKRAVLRKNPHNDRNSKTTPSLINGVYFYDHKYKYKTERELQDRIVCIDSGKLLYSFIPEVTYELKNRVLISKAIGEVHLNFALNSNIKEYYTNNYDDIRKGNNIKRKTFEDILSIYTEQFSFNKKQDYYYLEGIMGFNLSMKVYDYLWRNANIFLSKSSDDKEKRSKILEKYIEKVIKILYKVKSPYLRLRLTDIVLQPYGYIKDLKKEQCIPALIAICKFLNTYVDQINEIYITSYDSMFYYLGRELSRTDKKELVLEGLDKLINEEYKNYIRLDAESIINDFAFEIDTSRSEKEFGSQWNELLNDARGKRKDIYEYIIKSIMNEIKGK